MDLATLIGFVACFAVVIYGIIDSGGVASVGNFVDVPSVAITLGGAFFSTMVQFSMKDFFGGFKSFAMALKTQSVNIPEMIQRIIDLSNVARKEGLLSLEEAASDLNDSFLKKGVLLIVDGTDPELVRAILDTELISLEGRHKKNFGFWDALGAMGPAWGMIGTLIGLINMLGSMDDPSTVGPSMATALITTLYGSMLANWVTIPICGKLKANNDEELILREVMIEGLLSIQAGENPRVIEEKLKSFLAPKDRAVEAEPGGELDG